MTTSIKMTKGLFVLVLLLLNAISFAQLNQNANQFQNKGQHYYKLFQKAEMLNNYPFTDKQMVTNLQKAEINFHRALVLFKTKPDEYKEQIKKLETYLKIIYYHFDQIKERRKEYTTSE